MVIIWKERNHRICVVKITTNMLDWCNILDILSHFYGLNLTSLFFLTWMIIIWEIRLALRKTGWRINFAAKSLITNPPHSPQRKLKYWCSLSLKRKQIKFLEFLNEFRSPYAVGLNQHQVLKIAHKETNAYA